MTTRFARGRSAAWTVLTVAGLALCGGCSPIQDGDIETFVSELLRNAVAAFLL